MRRRLTELLGDLNSMLVSRWLNDPKEDPTDIGEAVGLMLQLVVGLEGEIDVFIGGADNAAAVVGKTSQESGPDEETDLVDLITDEPVASMKKIEAPFKLAEGSV